MLEGATGQEVLIKRGDFPVQEQRGGGQQRDRRGERPESAGVVNAICGSGGGPGHRAYKPGTANRHTFPHRPSPGDETAAPGSGAWAPEASARRGGPQGSTGPQANRGRACPTRPPPRSRLRPFDGQSTRARKPLSILMMSSFIQKVTTASPIRRIGTSVGGLLAGV